MNDVMIGYVMASYRRTPLPHGWSRIRRGVLERDGYRCTMILDSDTPFTHPDSGVVMIIDAGDRCGARANQVHHMRSDTDHNERNLVSLCTYHHEHITASEAYIKSDRAALKQKKKTLKEHPGIL